MARSQRLGLVLLLLASLVALPTEAQEAEPVHGWTDDPAVPAAIAEWRPNIQPELYFENWDFWFWMDDGTFVGVQFVTSSFGFGIERQGSARFLVIEPHAVHRGGDGGEGIALGDRGFNWDNNDWGWEDLDDAVDVHWIDCYVRGTAEGLTLYARDRRRRVFLDLQITAESALFRPGDGRMEYGWDRHTFYSMQAMPRVRVEGRINRKAVREDPDAWVDVAGVGYVEHSLTNAYPYEVADAFLGFRALRDDGLSILVDSVQLPTARGARAVPWMLVLLDGEVVFESYDVTILQDDVRREEWGGTEYRIPYGYVIDARAGDDRVQIQVGNSELVSADSFLNRISAFLRSVIRTVMSPYDFELSNDYDALVRVDGVTAGVAGRGWTTFNATR
jgi:hypothetical protein